MKCLLLLLTVLSTLITPITAFGPRGAAERILYYYAYLAEEITEPDDSKRIIGVGCKTGGARCNFNEFLEYIWEPIGKETETNRPTGVNIIAEGEDFKGLKIATLYNRIVKWRATDKTKLTGNVKATRVVSTAVSVGDASPYYDALSKVGGPIGALEANIDSLNAHAADLQSQIDADAEAGKDKDPAKASELQSTKDEIKARGQVSTNGKASATMLHDMRWQDLEKYRPAAIAKLLSVDSSKILTKPGPDTQGVQGAWKQIDSTETAKALGDGGDTKLANAIATYSAMDGSPKEHMAAINSADQARVGCGCT